MAAQAVRVGFLTPDFFKNGVTISPPSYIKTEVFASGVLIGTALGKAANEIFANLEPGVYDITAVATADVNGTQVSSQPSAPVQLTVVQPIVGDEPNPPSNVQPSQL